MKTTLDILQIAVIVVYIVMVVYILWANAKLLKSDSEIRRKYEELLKDKYILQLAHDRLRLAYERKVKECEHLQPSVSDIALSIEKEDLKQKNDELKEKYKELKRKYDLLYAESATLEYVNGRIKEIAEAQCPSIASLYKRMMLMREQSIKRIMNPEAHIEELLKNMPCAHDAEPTDFTTAFESAAQESSKEDWNKSVKKAKAEEEQ